MLINPTNKNKKAKKKKRKAQNEIGKAHVSEM